MRQAFYFTLAANQGGPGCIRVLAPDMDKARATMISVYGIKWSMPYNDFNSIHVLDREILDTLHYEEPQ